METIALPPVGRDRSRDLPLSTYRLQFHGKFTFKDAAQIVPYLHQLGITECYASPYLNARTGSAHGYDICDHSQLNPEVGSVQEYEAWTDALAAHGMGQILDMVPNHMGIVGNENLWWNDLLENGQSSPFAEYFDIDWHPAISGLAGRVLLPILGDSFGKVLESGELQLRYEAGSFSIHYYDHRFPVAPKSYELILAHRFEDLERRLEDASPHLVEYQSIKTAISHLPERNDADPDKTEERTREKEVIKRRLAVLSEESAEIAGFIGDTVAEINGQPGVPSSFDMLDQLLNVQAYRLCFWRVASDEINYRRFFDINELAALCMEKSEVFSATHELVLRLIWEGRISGLRIDHPDGLYDPRQYLQRLQQFARLGQAAIFPDGPEQTFSDDHAALPLYVVVEKILGPDEELQPDWPVHGTTGYEFLNLLNGLFVDSRNQTAMDRLYSRWIGNTVKFQDMVYQKKLLILQVALSSELHMLATQLDRLSEMHRWSRDFTFNSLRIALREIIACYPVYRSYISDSATGQDAPKIQGQDRRYVETATARARRRNPAINASLFNFVRDMLLLQYREGATEVEKAEQRRFVGKFQQVTGPVMAKGMEDTTFYIYNRLISLNEVGGEPVEFGVFPAEFHERNKERQRRRPFGLLSTTTHDTKRSEDARARINVLSELPVEWRKSVFRWHRINKRHLVDVGDAAAPDRNESYMFYQSLVGAWPLEDGALLRPESPNFGEFVDRINQFMQKAIHEAKEHSSWINPDEEYDAAVAKFVNGVLGHRNRRFLSDFLQFEERISHHGLLNSLAQTLLKITSPGVPDTYQGTELWDFSLVDPDNRRPVDYDLRRKYLSTLDLQSQESERSKLARELIENKEDGRIKLYMTSLSMRLRRERPSLFTTGEYLPVFGDGPRADHIVSFIRRSGQDFALIVVPRLTVELIDGTNELPTGESVWRGSSLVLPESSEGLSLQNTFTGETIEPVENEGSISIPLSQVFQSFPVALFTSRA